MSHAKAGDTVRVHYTGKLNNGSQFDSSARREPLEFAIGPENMITGLNKAVEGMAVGESKSVRIPAEEAFGPRYDQLIREVPNSELPNDFKPSVGMPLEARGQDGGIINLVILAVGEESVTVDGNHPLAGQSLDFDIELVEIV